jgi:hypothetical protein
LTAAELRRRARVDLRATARRRELVAIAAVTARATAEAARADAELAARRAVEALAAAAVTFGGPEKAAAVTGIATAEFRAARRDIPAQKALEIAEDVVTSAAERAARRMRGGRSYAEPGTAPTSGTQVTSTSPDVPSA